MSTSHDQYLKFVSNELIDEVLNFHAKGNYVIHPATQHLSTLHHVPAADLATLSGNELSLHPLPSCSDNPSLAPQPLPHHHPLRRNDSCNDFKASRIDFETIKAILAPLVRKDSSSKRGYPSGGALYPIEVFCVNLNNRVEGWPKASSALHLLANSRTLEAHSQTIDDHNLSSAIIGSSTPIGSPALALVYYIYLPKALFKYRQRGYRLALMEAGSMYMLTDLRCKELGLNSRPWAAFTDHQVTKHLNLNPTLFLSTCIQLIG
ncbi:SagB/ThcOx family dehydrogenase [Pseudomonas alloputida]|uniref:SagB/ThcOx family dehydrogenase n=1 Tax=Pseudomonas TaxID=286 RepID=UPI003EECE59C